MPVSLSLACLARDGHTVVGVDIDEAKIAKLSQWPNSPDFSAARSLLEVNDFCRVPPKVPGSVVVGSGDGSCRNTQFCMSTSRPPSGTMWRG